MGFSIRENLYRLHYRNSLALSTSNRDRLIISIWRRKSGFDKNRNNQISSGAGIGYPANFKDTEHFRNFVSKHAQIGPIRLARRDFAKYRVDYASAFLVEWIRAQWFVNRYLVHVIARPLARRSAPIIVLTVQLYTYVEMDRAHCVSRKFIDPPSIQNFPPQSFLSSNEIMRAISTSPRLNPPTEENLGSKLGWRVIKILKENRRGYRGKRFFSY